jgi:hypothetical protein
MRPVVRSILVEEVLSSYDAPAIKHGETGGQGCDIQCPRFCGITMGDESEQFLRAFHQIDLDAPIGTTHFQDLAPIPNLTSSCVGRIDVKLHHDDGNESWRLLYLDVPANMTEVEVILFSSFGNGSAECRSIEVRLRIFSKLLALS